MQDLSSSAEGPATAWTSGSLTSSCCNPVIFSSSCCSDPMIRLFHCYFITIICDCYRSQCKCLMCRICRHQRGHNPQVASHCHRLMQPTTLKILPGVTPMLSALAFMRHCCSIHAWPYSEFFQRTVIIICIYQFLGEEKWSSIINLRKYCGPSPASAFFFLPYWRDPNIWINPEGMNLSYIYNVLT